MTENEANGEDGAPDTPRVEKDALGKRKLASIDKTIGEGGGILI